MLVRCSLATDVVGASDWDERCTNQLHHFYCGDVRQCGEPLVCGASVSQFDPDASHKSVTQSMLKRYKVFRLPTGLLTSFV